MIVDPDGGVWFSHFSEQFLSKLDPKTGKVTDYPIPVLKPDHPKGTLDLEVDPDGNIWVGMMYQGGMARFDRKTEQFRIYPVPQEWQTDATQQSHFSVAGMKADGKLWVKNSDRSQVMKLDPVTGDTRTSARSRFRRTAGRSASTASTPIQQNNAYILEFGNGGIGKIDAKTGADGVLSDADAVSRARRGRVDAQNRLWFAEYGSNGVAHVRSEDRRRSPSGRSRWSGSRPTTWWPTATARSGRSTNRPTVSAGSIPRPATGSTIRCRATATSAASFVDDRARRCRCGPATTTPLR